MYNLEYCNYVYEFFNEDFFVKELGKKLGNCTIFVNKKEEFRKVFDHIDYSELDRTYGLSLTWQGHNYIWINPILLGNKKLLVNTILHEMIHIYVNEMQPDTRRYRSGHGSLWTRTARYAQKLYGKELGEISQFATKEESQNFSRISVLRKTRTLANAYLIKLVSSDIVPVKNLTDEQIERLKETNIIGIYHVKPEIQQKPSTRVTKYISWEKLLDCIENGIDYDTETVCSHLRVKLGTDTTIVWLNKR